MRPAALEDGLCSLMFTVALLAKLAPGSIAGMAQGWCAIAEPDASVDVVGGHDVVKNRGETVNNVFVLWCQLLKWEKQFVSAP